MDWVMPDDILDMMEILFSCFRKIKFRVYGLGDARRYCGYDADLFWWFCKIVIQ